MPPIIARRLNLCDPIPLTERYFVVLRGLVVINSDSDNPFVNGCGGWFRCGWGNGGCWSRGLDADKAGLTKKYEVWGEERTYGRRRRRWRRWRRGRRFSLWFRLGFGLWLWLISRFRSSTSLLLDDLDVVRYKPIISAHTIRRVPQEQAW